MTGEEMGAGPSNGLRVPESMVQPESQVKSSKINKIE